MPRVDRLMQMTSSKTKAIAVDSRAGRVIAKLGVRLVIRWTGW